MRLLKLSRTHFVSKICHQRRCNLSGQELGHSHKRFPCPIQTHSKTRHDNEVNPNSSCKNRNFPTIQSVNCTFQSGHLQLIISAFLVLVYFSKFGNHVVLKFLFQARFGHSQNIDLVQNGNIILADETTVWPKDYEIRQDFEFFFLLEK